MNGQRQITIGCTRGEYARVIRNVPLADVPSSHPFSRMRQKRTVLGAGDETQILETGEHLLTRSKQAGGKMGTENKFDEQAMGQKCRCTPSACDIIEPDSLILLPLIFGFLVLAVCFLAWAIMGIAPAQLPTFITFVALSSTAFIGGALLLIWRVRKIRCLFRHGLECSARIVQIKGWNDTWKFGSYELRKNVLRLCFYEYQVDGQVYRGRSRFESRVVKRPLTPGDVVPILVDPNHPKISILKVIYTTG